MNNVSLIGRLTKDVELRYTTNQKAVCGFTLAVNREYKQEGQPEADFLPIVAWNGTAEFASKYFTKGQQIGVTGRIQTRTWDDENGTKHYVTEVVADKVYFASDKKDGQGATQQNNQQPHAAPTNPPPSQQQARSSNNQQAAQPAQQGSTPPWMRK